MASMQDNQHNGSTRLHKDLTDAVNIMVWSANFPDGTPGDALWHIYPPWAAEILSGFLRVRAGFRGQGDPIHSQTICMTPSLIELFFVEHGIQPYTIYQRPGQAVFIPAGCPHQVCVSTNGGLLLN
jgi:lysine-specific demethylase 3